MRTKIKQLLDAASRLDHAYLLKGRSMAIKPNMVMLLYALYHDDDVSQRKLRDEWLLPPSTINTLVIECRNAGHLTLKPIPGKRRECRLRLTESGRKFAAAVLAEIHRAEETAMRETLAKFSPEFIDALEFYSKTFHATLNPKEQK